MKVQLRAFGRYLGDIFTYNGRAEEFNIINCCTLDPMINLTIDPPNRFDAARNIKAKFKWNGDYAGMANIPETEHEVMNRYGTTIEPVRIFDLIDISRE